MSIKFCLVVIDEESVKIYFEVFVGYKVSKKMIFSKFETIIS